MIYFLYLYFHDIMYYMLPFSSIIRLKRKELGISVPALSRLSGVHPAIIYRLENDIYASDKNRWLLVESLNIPFDSKLFVKKIKEKRELLGWLIPELARVSKVSVSVIYAIESKKKLPSMAFCYKLAKALNLQLEAFIIDPSEQNITKHSTT